MGIADPYRMIIMAGSGAATGAISEIVDKASNTKKTERTCCVYIKPAERIAENSISRGIERNS